MTRERRTRRKEKKRRKNQEEKKKKKKNRVVVYVHYIIPRERVKGCEEIRDQSTTLSAEPFTEQFIQKRSNNFTI